MPCEARWFFSEECRSRSSNDETTEGDMAGDIGGSGWGDSATDAGVHPWGPADDPRERRPYRRFVPEMAIPAHFVFHVFRGFFSRQCNGCTRCPRFQSCRVRDSLAILRVARPYVVGRQDGRRHRAYLGARIRRRMSVAINGRRPRGGWSSSGAQRGSRGENQEDERSRNPRGLGCRHG